MAAVTLSVHLVSREVDARRQKKGAPDKVWDVYVFSDGTKTYTYEVPRTRTQISVFREDMKVVSPGDCVELRTRLWMPWNRRHSNEIVLTSPRLVRHEKQQGLPLTECSGCGR